MFNGGYVSVSSTTIVNSTMKGAAVFAFKSVVFVVLKIKH